MITTNKPFAFVPIVALVLAPSAGAADLLVEDFNANDGSFTQEATGNTPIPAVYSSATGTWSIEGDDSGPATNTITSPAIAVPATAGIQVSFDHRYSIEGGDWDGAGLQISIDGGEFKNVPNSAFTQNGYTNINPLIGNHVLNGLDGFSMDSPGYLDGTFITSVANVGGATAGSSIQVRFVGAFDEGARGANIPNWEIDSVKVETLPDTDGDGMPDVYEDANSLDKNVDDSGDDPDSDNSTNLAEYLNGTAPQDNDTDDDLVLDGAETKSGTFVDANDTGTDPLRADTDGDGFTDGAETNTGTYVDDTNTGTNPNLADTDGDGTPDKTEVALSTDPSDGTDFPTGWTVRNATSGSALNSIANTRALFAGSNILAETITENTVINFRDNATGPFPDPVAFPVLGAQDAAVDDYGLLANGRIFIDEPGFYTFGFNSDDGGGLYIDGEPVVIVDLNRGSQTSLGAVKLTYGNHSVEFLYWERGGGAQVQLFAAKEPGDKTTEAFVLDEYELLETSYTELVDTDSDMLPDAWEIKYFGDLTPTAEGDNDSDNSSNLEELTRGTYPDNNDSDEDGVLDGNEDGGGTFVSNTQTGTDPCNPDTDGDGLKDGVENGSGTFVSATQTGSDPNLEDTDEDRQKDGFEVANSTDPNDPESKSAVATITVIGALIGGDLTDPEDDGIQDATVPGPPQTAGTNFNWIGISASEEQYFGDFGTATEGAFDIFDNEVGGGNAKWCCGGAPVNATVEFEEEVSLTHFTITSSNDTPARDPLDFTIQGSNDGVNFEVIYERQDDVSLWDARNQTVRIDLPSPSDSYRFIRYDVTRTGGANHALNELEYFGEVGPSAPLEVIAFSYDEETRQISLTWNSRDNRTYSVFTSTDLFNFDTDINDSIESQGDTTTFTFTNFTPEIDKLFFRVVENE